MNLINKIYQVFTDQQKKEFKILVFYSFLTMILETFSISLIIPLLNNILNNDNTLFIKIIGKISFSKFINNENIFFFLIIFFFFIFLFKSIFLIYYTLFKNKFIYSIRSSLSNRMFSNILKADYSYHVQNNSSKIINALTREVEEMVSLIDSGITFFTELLIVIGLFMLIIFYEPINLLAIIFLFIIALTIYQVTKKKVSIWGSFRQQHEANRILHVNQSIDGIKEIKISNLEDIFLSRFEYHNFESAKIGRNMNSLTQIPRILLEFFGLIAIFLIIIFYNLTGKNTTEVIAVLGILVVTSFKILPSMNRTLGTIQQLRFARPTVELIYYFIKDKIFNAIANNYPQSKEINFNSINFNKLSFSYIDNKSRSIKIFEDITFSINKGEFIGIVGKTGVGKTTLLNIILGLLKPTQGNILVNGNDVSSDIKSWQSIIGYVPQNIFLLDDTIKNNIVLDTASFNLENFNKAIIDSELFDFINQLPLKFDTNIGERGIKISGGQKQRIGLARILYKNPSLIVLDEATSSLDILTEEKIIKTINSLVPSKTIIAVSHRLSTLENCNKIFSLENGKLKIIKC